MLFVADKKTEGRRVKNRNLSKLTKFFWVPVLCLILTVQSMPVYGARADAVEYVGDVDGDGSITPKDVTKLRRYLAGGWGVDVATEDGDVDEDGAITPKDVTKLRRYLAGGWGIILPQKNPALIEGVSIVKNDCPDNIFR